ncbi:hypothetical protein L195_g033938, partial [Trifolium pratense]
MAKVAEAVDGVAVAVKVAKTVVCGLQCGRRIGGKKKE